jgi:uncharacterized membrane protein YqjE
VDGPDASADTPPPGSLRGVGTAVLALVGTRAELLGVELREETLRAFQLLLWGAVAVLFLAASLVFAGAWVVMAIGEERRLLALGIVTVLYAGGAIAVFLWIRGTLRSAPLPFSATASELKADIDALSGGPLKKP